MKLLEQTTDVVAKKEQLYDALLNDCLEATAIMFASSDTGRIDMEDVSLLFCEKLGNISPKRIREELYKYFKDLLNCSIEYVSSGAYKYLTLPTKKLVVLKWILNFYDDKQEVANG
jgi:hypothetical protein